MFLLCPCFWMESWLRLELLCRYGLICTALAKVEVYLEVEESKSVIMVKNAEVGKEHLASISKERAGQTC